MARSGSSSRPLPEALVAAGAGDAVRSPEANLALPQVGYIRNPRSHRNKAREPLNPEGAQVSLAEPRSRQELEQALEDFARRKIDLLAIGGGDGTIRDVLTRGAALFGDEWPAIIVLPQGKTNALAGDLGIDRQWSLDEAIEASRRGRFVKRRPIVVESIDGLERTRYGFLFGAGIFNAAIDTGQVAHRHGAFQSFAIGMTAAFGVLQALFGLGRSAWRRISRIRIAALGDGPPVPRSDHGDAQTRLLAGFTTIESFPLGITPFAKMTATAPIRYFIIDAPLRRAVLLSPPAAMGWQHPRLAKLGMHRGDGEAFEIELEDPYILDGERFPAGAYRISAGPELRFVTP